MKLLEISEQIEKSIITLFDVALKAGGASILSHIDAIRNAVKIANPSGNSVIEPIVPASIPVESAAPEA